MKLKDYLDKTSEELENMTTQQLLMLRKLCYRSRRTCGCYYGDCAVTGDDLIHNNRMSALLTKILAILPAREHVPNKADRKRARQEAAKKGR